jgi:molybdopterin-synthase adenylyltransferase
VTYNQHLYPAPEFKESVRRTVSTWGRDTQSTVARLHVGIVGAGSVGSIVAEAFARTGVERITLIDFDTVEKVNLDRLLHATEEDAAAARSKVEVLAAALRRGATAHNFQVETCEYAVSEEVGFRNALDCDVLFSCVDRPWGRSVLNFIAHAHLIPVIDGGIAASVTAMQRLRRADWRAHIAGPGRRCLACLGQFDPGLVSTEREGRLDDPSYIAGLAQDHPLRRNENVFAFSLGAASLQVLQALSMVVAPLGISNPGAQMYHFTTGRLDIEPESGCESACPYPTMIGRGDRTGFLVTGRYGAAEVARATRVSRLGADSRGFWRTNFARARRIFAAR